MFDLNDERYFGTYCEILKSFICCTAYKKLCTGQLKLSDGSQYNQRTITVSNVTCPEADAYDAAIMFLTQAARILADIDDDKAVRLVDMPRFYDTTCPLTMRVMDNGSKNPDDTFWLTGLLHALYSKTRLSSSNFAEAMVLSKIDLAVTALLEASPLSEEATRQYISKLWNSSEPIPSMSKYKEPDQAQTQGKTKPSGGCYVATALYGSYDCPEVWVLRRFRDYCLAKSIPGRLFIRLYYAVSPALVKHFGTTKWFNGILRAWIANLVIRCQKNGYSNKPYVDKAW